MSTVDLIFYGYDGKFTAANSSALAFFSFLDSFLGAPAQLINRTLARNGPIPRIPFEYENITIVAHSLGAVVTRRALLEADQRRAPGKAFPWLDKVKLLLFAPAHLGAYSAEVVLSYLSSQGWWLGNLIGHITLSKSPLITDLVSTSHVITTLETDTQKALASAGGKVGHLSAKRVIWALHDDVVKNGRFCQDEPADAPPLDTNHVQVCKAHRLDDATMNIVLTTI